MAGIKSAWNKKKPIIGFGHSKARKMAWLFLTVILCLCFFSLSRGYLKYVRETIRRDAKSSLEELGNHIAQSLYNEIKRTSEVLGSLALEVAQRDMETEEELLLFLTKQSEFWGFYDLAAIDKDGISHHQDGMKDTPMNRKLLSDALNLGIVTFDFVMAGGEDCVVFYVPLPKDVREGTEYLAVSGTYAVNKWDLLMDINIYNDQAVTQIISDAGVVITRGRNSEEKTYYNLLDYLEGAEFEAGITLEQVSQSLLAGKSAQFSYRLKDTEYYLSCTPIGFNGWNLVFTVPSTIVNYAGEQMTSSVLIISATLTIIFLLILFYFWVSQSQAKKRIWDAAYVDDVTGGENRHKFMLDAPALLERKDGDYVLVYSNIDQFKLLNQRYGTVEADFILCTLHEAFSKMVRAQECCARLTADHFVLLLHEEGIEERLKSLAEEQTMQTLQMGGKCYIRLTFGLYRIEQGDDTLTQAIDRANLAMKMSPMTESGIAVYNETMMESAAREKALTERMLQPSFKEELTIYLQPKVDLVTGLVTGMEALARWKSAEYGSVSPGEFIPLAEKAGIICQIDWVAFELVCKTLSRWQREGKELIPVSFNLSKAQLTQPDFLDKYRSMIHEYGVSCGYLDFEFTESLLYENSGALQAAVQEIHDMGARCSMDDFGFGYSSLGLLGQFEADTLKLDRSFFMEDAKPESRNSRIVYSVIQIAKSLGMDTVAEGVEDEKQVEMLREFGCGSVQGFYYSKPLPIEEFEIFVQTRKEMVTGGIKK